ncbi:hypothetical protein WJX74_000613 [Apatococcus lobatus]|uniref:Uncharacterized protein n=1 Tax=Apatococcus lobatus TaxID=904363 RepID=A0AAW1R023_9CHLO
MPVALESQGGTTMLLRVQENVLSARPVVKLMFPATTPDAFGLLQCDAAGKMTWLTQYVNALVPPPNLVHFLSGRCDGAGNASLAGDSPIELKPYDGKVVYALALKARKFSASGVAAVYAQTGITYDPSQPLTGLWAAGEVEKYGDNADVLQLTVALRRTVTNGVVVTFAGSARPGDTVHVDVVVYDPTGLPAY